MTIVFKAEPQFSRDLHSDDTMTDENYSGAPVVNHATSVPSNSSPLQVDSTQMGEISVLLEQCRGDLELVERILGKLESPISQAVTSSQEKMVRCDETELNCRPEGVDSKAPGYEAETVRRLAHHIENLYRAAQAHGVEEMLDELQAKMVRCLRMIPANRTHAKAS